MIKLQRLGHVLISVRDLERSKDFYTRILGFKVLEQDPGHGGLFLSIGGLGNTLDLFQCADPDAVASSDAELAGRNGLGVRHMAFAVETEDDLRDAYFALQSTGVPILRAIDHVSQKSIYFHDPDKSSRDRLGAARCAGHIRQGSRRRGQATNLFLSFEL